MVSIDSKHGEFKELYILLRDFKNYKSITTETKSCKNRILNNVNQLYNKYFDTYKKNPDSEDINKRNENFFMLTSLKYLVRKKKKSSSYEDRSDTRQPQQLEQLKLDEIQKPLCLKVSRENFISLIKDVVDNLNNDKYKTTVDGNKYDLKNAKRVLPEIINKNISENEARKLFNGLIKPDIDVNK